LSLASPTRNSMLPGRNCSRIFWTNKDFRLMTSKTQTRSEKCRALLPGLGFPVSNQN
jgi:uncharacterized protein with PIN domain